MTFRVGQKVECIDDKGGGKYNRSGSLPAVSRDLHGLKRGVTYTIRDVGTVLGVVACRLEEITREFEPVICNEAWFAQARFRPVRETDISIFTKTLKRRRLAVHWRGHGL